MFGNRCKKCTWWDNRPEFTQFVPEFAGKPDPGFCRKDKPGAVSKDGYYYGRHVVMDADEFCGAFKGE